MDTGGENASDLGRHGLDGAIDSEPLLLNAVEQMQRWNSVLFSVS